MKIFNLNNKVKVKLTEEGIKILENKHNEYLKMYGDNPEVKALFGEFTIPEIDEDGYSSFSLVELMNIFGKYMTTTNQILPIEMEVAISDEYLVEYESEKGRKI